MLLTEELRHRETVAEPLLEVLPVLLSVAVTEGEADIVLLRHSVGLALGLADTEKVADPELLTEELKHSVTVPEPLLEELPVLLSVAVTEGEADIVLLRHSVGLALGLADTE